MPELRIGIVGASGLVGQTLLRVLEEHAFPYRELRLFASEQSAGQEVFVNEESLQIQEISPRALEGLDLVFFVSTNAVSLKWAPVAVEKGALVIDNSKAYRMDPTVPLIVPEINGSTLFENTGIIANPNCSTVQTVLSLYPLHKAFRLKRVVVSTYQAVSGSGKQALEQLRSERSGKTPPETVYPHPIFNNCLPHIGTFLENGYTDEEMKMVNESRKILGLPDLRVTATTVRVPVEYSHSISVNVELETDFSLDQVYRILEEMPGIIVKDDPSQNLYPLSGLAKDRDEVFVGRIRRDFSVASGLNYWVVADNLRKGAATNALQIAEYWLRHKP